LGADASHVFQLLLYVADAAIDFSTVGFELVFTGASSADAAA